MKTWGWVWLYGIGIGVVLLLGANPDRMSMVKDMTIGDTQLPASNITEFTAYTVALLLFWLLSHRAAAELPEDGKGFSFLRRVIPPAALLVVVLAGHKVMLPLAGPFMAQMDRRIYNLIFLLGAIGVALWLALTLLRSSTLLTQSAESVTSPQEPAPIEHESSREATVRVERPSVRRTLGRFAVIKELGRGAMGVVYLGKDPTIQRFVALKTVRFDEVDEPSQLPESKRRFFREAESAGRLSHPYIVTIFDAGEEEGLGYIAMEVLDGITLKDWCRKENLQPLKQVLELVAKVAEGLDHAHSQGVVHRDIKPANIMITKNGVVKITDFGIARISSSTKTQADVIVGTPSYMSPEQVAGEKVDGRSDLFSLGVVLYELLTGEKPFQGESIASLMFQITHTPHRSPAQLRTDLPPCCAAIIDRALCKEVTKRYQRGLELAEDLRACLRTCT